MARTWKFGRPLFRKDQRKIGGPKAARTVSHRIPAVRITANSRNSKPVTQVVLEVSQSDVLATRTLPSPREAAPISTALGGHARVKRAYARTDGKGAQRVRQVQLIASSRGPLFGVQWATGSGRRRRLFAIGVRSCRASFSNRRAAAIESFLEPPPTRQRARDIAVMDEYQAADIDSSSLARAPWVKRFSPSRWTWRTTGGVAVLEKR